MRFSFVKPTSSFTHFHRTQEKLATKSKVRNQDSYTKLDKAHPSARRKRGLQRNVGCSRAFHGARPWAETHLSDMHHAALHSAGQSNYREPSHNTLRHCFGNMCLEQIFLEEQQQANSVLKYCSCRFEMTLKKGAGYFDPPTHLLLSRAFY